MGILDGIQQLFETLRGQFINIPTNNPLSWLYVIFNLALLLFASIGGSIGNLFGGS